MKKTSVLMLLKEWYKMVPLKLPKLKTVPLKMLSLKWYLFSKKFLMKF